jgi:hypothetical protein
MHTIHHSLLTSFPAPGKRKRDEKRREKEKKEIAENTKIFEGVVSISSLSHGEAGLGSFHRYARPPAKTHEACRRTLCSMQLRKDMWCPLWHSMSGGFSMPSYRFLRSLLWYYGLKLHHLSPSGVLHIVAFVNLYEPYQGSTLSLICGSTSSASSVRRIPKLS